MRKLVCPNWQTNVSQLNLPPGHTEQGMDADLELYIRECGNILGITENISVHERSAKRILSIVLRQLVNWKTLNPQTVE